jgi:3-keto-5-aminohexanoate cleavage enzyme
MTPEERLQPVQLNPEMATLSTGSVNFGEDLFVNTMEEIRTFARTMIAKGVKPEIEAFDSGMVQNALTLVKEGILELPLHFDFVLGVPGAMPGTPEALMYMRSLLPAGCTWTVAGIGRTELPLGAMAIILGGHVRVGFEDNIYYKRGQLAESNAQLVQRMVRLAEELGREVATPEEARKILHL